MRALRQRLGLNQQELADALGQHRLTIVQYERGIRSKDKKPVEIPRVVELACAAIWAGVDCIELDSVEPEDANQRVSLPDNAISEPHKAQALRALEKRGVKILENRLFFPWSSFKRAWPHVSFWADQNDIELIFHNVLYRDEVGEGVSVLMFPQKNTDFMFKLRWIAGNDDSERPTTGHS